MSVEFGGGSTGDDRMPEALRGAGYDVFGYLYERFAARLFDYCLGVLADEVAAVIAVQDTLVTANAQIGTLPDPDRLRLLLYSVAHRQCVGKLSRRRAKPRRSPQMTTSEEVVAEQAGPADAATRTTGQDTLPVLAAALSRLADRDREVLNLAFRHGIEGADLAVVLGVSPRRAPAMLSDAGARFRKSAALVAVLRGDLTGCEALETITAKRHPASPPLTPERRELLIRHLESCPACAAQHGDQVLGPEMLSAVPFATLPLTLRLRITGPGPARGSHRREDGSRTSPRGGNVSRHGARRSVPPARLFFSLVLVTLAVLGVVVYKLVLTSSARPASAPVAAGIQTPASTRSPLTSPTLDPQGSKSQPKPAPSHALLGPTPLGVLPFSTPPSTGAPTTPASAHSKPSTTVPSTPPRTTPPPTTPPPTTPPPTTPPPTTPPPTTPPPSTSPPTTSPSITPTPTV
jgi:DNA-directed RNA polymerase specialized sigma24 family protein